MSYFAAPGGSVPEFRAQAQGYDPGNAWWLARCSQLAYESKPRVAYELEGAGFAEVTFVDFSGSQGFLARHPPSAQAPAGFAILAFRGTENDWNDILTDIDFAKTKLPDEDLRAHAGFVYALKDVWGTGVGALRSAAIKVDWYGMKGVSDALDELLEVPVFFTGHSLGAALATLAAHYWPPRALYTYGSPRVASRALAAVWRRRRLPAFRFVNASDIVPRVPPAAWLFRHVGELMYLTGSGKLLRGRRAALWFVLGSFQVWLLPLVAVTPYAWLAWLRPGMFTNHRISAYVGKLAP
ncbi:MAG TPA: lipase family protein [Burkholderiales bacterium]|nr:lipase family protein [Burkholderiales bacterium]